MNTELINCLDEADAQDFTDCLKENFDRDCDEYYKMLAEIYYNDKAHFNVLSAGCKAAMIVYLKLAR